MNIRYPIYEGVYRILTLHRVQLYVHTGHIPRVGCGSHRVF